MSDAESQDVAEPDPTIASFPGDPAAAAALARRRVRSAWKWFWVVLVAAVAAWSMFIGLIASGAGKQSDEAIAVGIIIAVTISLFVSIPLYFVVSHNRTAAMADACETMGFRFSEKVSKEQLASYDRLPLFKQGHSHKGYYLMEGKVGDQDLALMEYSYTTGHGKQQQTHKQTVVILADIGDLPDFELSPKSFWRLIGEAFGYKSIAFEEYPAFAKAYTLKGPDPEDIRAAFRGEALAYFAANPGWSIEVQDEWMAVYRKETASTPESCPQLIADALRILQLFENDGEPEPDSAAMKPE